MYVMQTCPDCEYVEKQVEGNPNFEVIDIGKHVRNLKEFLKLRDTIHAMKSVFSVLAEIISTFINYLLPIRWQHDIFHIVSLLE